MDGTVGRNRGQRGFGEYMCEWVGNRDWRNTGIMGIWVWPNGQREKTQCYYKVGTFNSF